jgi:hypothetical protein
MVSREKFGLKFLGGARIDDGHFEFKNECREEMGKCLEKTEGEEKESAKVKAWKCSSPG